MNEPCTKCQHYTDSPEHFYGCEHRDDYSELCENSPCESAPTVFGTYAWSRTKTDLYVCEDCAESLELTGCFARSVTNVDDFLVQLGVA